MRRAQKLLTQIIGILLILVGMRLLLAPNVYSTRRKTAIRTREKTYSVDREKSITVPRLVSSFVVAGGAAVLILATRASR